MRWSYHHVLRDNGLSDGHSTEQLTSLLFPQDCQRVPDAAVAAPLAHPDGYGWPSSGAGEYLTPRPLIDAIVAYVRPTPPDTIIDCIPLATRAFTTDQTTTPI